MNKEYSEMNKKRTGVQRARQAIAALVTAGGLGLAAAPAQALDFYMGAGIGQSNVGIDADDLEITDFDRKDTGWKLFAGLKVAMFGAELDYIHFGKPNGTGSGR
jgi:opacity protein-like surface antigen